jgi:hypothetical protein
MFASEGDMTLLEKRRSRHYEKYSTGVVSRDQGNDNRVDTSTNKQIKCKQTNVEFTWVLHGREEP